MKNWQKRYPPYEGSEPYLYFAFAEADSAKAWQIMRILLERGCRVWYGSGPSGNADELLRRQERAEDANLTLLYLTDAACADKDTKSNILVNQKNGKHILCLDPDGADRRLSMGLYETVPHLPLYRLKSRKEIENAVIRAEGFSQEILGEPVRVEGSGSLGKLTALFCVLAVLLALAQINGLGVDIASAIGYTGIVIGEWLLSLCCNRRIQSSPFLIIDHSFPPYIGSFLPSCPA